MDKQREIWVDKVKIIACIFVVLGHFFQSMVKSNIIEDNDIYQWFNTTIYYFHVPLFFLCSGYLYQKYSVVNSVNSWLHNLLKKFISLGIPYFVFSSATWVLKSFFSSSVNDEVGGLIETLFINPTSPFWYLYVLFFVFLITPSMVRKQSKIIICFIAVAIKIISISGFDTGIYCVDKTMSNEVWFVLGMLLPTIILKMEYLKPRCVGECLAIILGMLFIIFSLLPMHFFAGFSTLMTLLSCASIVLFVFNFYKGKTDEKKTVLGKYTMPIFLMHTLFAAPFRAILIKIGITDSVLHVVLGLTMSFVGPIVAMLIMDKLKPLDFVVYPNRYIKLKKGDINHGRKET